jgi:hypothetical protein
LETASPDHREIHGYRIFFIPTQSVVVLERIVRFSSDTAWNTLPVKGDLGEILAPLAKYENEFPDEEGDEDNGNRGCQKCLPRWYRRARSAVPTTLSCLEFAVSYSDL